MKKHFVIMCLSYFLIGAGATVQQVGIKSGLGILPTLVISCGCTIFFVITAFTSTQKVKEALFKKEKEAIK